MDQGRKPDVLPFKTSARTVDLLGRQQIAGIPTAIQELVKNSYDALAKNVSIDYFEPSNALVVLDDGTGMSRDDFARKWLTLGTSSRMAEATIGSAAFRQRVRLGRPITGEKGIGRLSMAAIGRLVLIVSHWKHTSEVTGETIHSYIVAAVHWGLFELPEISIDDIKIPIMAMSDFPSSEDVRKVCLTLKDSAYSLLPRTGNATLIQRIEFDVTNATQNFAKHFESVRRRLANESGTAFVICPVDDAFSEDLRRADESSEGESVILQTLTGFSDVLRTKDSRQEMKLSVAFHRSDGTMRTYPLEDGFFDCHDLLAADHRFVGHFDERGRFCGDIYIFGKLVGKGHVVECLSGKGDKPAKCGPFDLVLGYVQGNQRQSMLDAVQHERLSLKLKRFGGLYIYRDGIRLLPYGRADYDFLGLESDRVRSASRYFFSYHRMFGSIAITKANNGALVEKAGREGLMENAAYREFKTILKNFFRRIAAEFFSEHTDGDGTEQSFWAEHRQRLEMLSRLSKERERSFDRKRNAFKKKLANFFKLQGERHFEKEVSRILDSLVESLYDESAAASPARRELSREQVIAIQQEALSAIRGVERALTIAYPVGVSLDLEQREDWDSYLKVSGRVYSDVILPGRARAAVIIRNYMCDEPDSASYREIVKGIVAKTLSDAQNGIERQVVQTGTLVEDLRRRFGVWKDDALLRYRQKADEATEKAERVVKDADGDINQQIEDILRISRPTAEGIVKVLDYIKGQVLPIQWQVLPDEGIATTQDLIAALNEENQDLKVQRLSDIELIQLGLAARAFHHEFNSAVVQARHAVKRLGALVKGDDRFEETARTLSASFSHLEQYIMMLTPFADRVDNPSEAITGVEMYEFLRNAFRGRLAQLGVRLITTNGFERHSQTGHRSVLFPVLFNLVDNALYWLGKSDVKERKVLLHAAEDGSVSVSNNGEPVGVQDRERIFAMGFSRKIGGRGLGLAISREILSKESLSIACVDPVREDMVVSFVIRPKAVHGKEEPEGRG